MLKWIKFSGASLSITFNPMHWRLVPDASNYTSKEWPDAKLFEGSVSWLFLTVRVWIDDGSW